GLQLLEPLGLVLLEAAVPVAPAVQGLLAGAEALAGLGDAEPSGQVGFGLAQLGDDFFGRVPLHDSSPGPAGPQRLSYHLDQFWGSRSQPLRGVQPSCHGTPLWTGRGGTPPPSPHLRKAPQRAVQRVSLTDGERPSGGGHAGARRPGDTTPGAASSMTAAP